ncbi:FAD-binding oxidoreductase [Candidatus Daviesbacteria bacterium]|nr:FAD-binding oxidoreductase [Candidatus Daviesbacteria bacterium]
MSLTTLFSQLSQVVKGEVLTDETTLNFYSHDASLFEVKPQVVIFPKDSEDVKNIVKFLAQSKKENPTLSITARSGGTDMTGGCLNDSMILDFSRYFKLIGEVNQAGTTVEPGVFYRDFEAKTLNQNLLMPSYPASKHICALGGMIANNAGGEKTLSHGKTIDYVTGLKMVLRDGGEYDFRKLTKDELQKKLSQTDFEGQIYSQVYKLIEENYDLIKNAKPKVSKNSTGYNIWDVWDKQSFDLSKIFVGAQGTLGLNTQITLKLSPRQNHYGLLVIYLNNLDLLPQLVNDVLQTKPESFEAFDDHTLKLALRFMPQFIQILGLKKTIEMGFQFLPSLFEFVFKGLPKFTLLIEFDGTTKEEVDQKIENLKSKIAHYQIEILLAKTERQAENYWAIRRESFNLLRKNVKNKHTAPFIDDFIVPPEHLIEFFPKLKVILEKHQLDYTIAGHMGDGNFHIIPLMDLSQPADREKIPVVEEEVNELVLAFKGSLSAEHNEGLVRGHYIKKMYGEKMFEIFKQIKRIFDPDNIFNPHKKTDANLEYSMQHIRLRF